MSYCVYKLENDKNELYFGMTKSPNKRWSDHMKNARDNGTCSSKKLWYDGDTVVAMQELEWFDTKEEAHEREKELIQSNNCVNKLKYDFDYKTYKKEYLEKNKEVNAQYHKEYREKNKEVIAEKRKEYDEKNKVKISEKKKIYHEKNKEKKNADSKEYYEKNKVKINEKKKEKIECNTCGSIVRRDCMANHKKSKKCLQTSAAAI